MKRSEVQLTDTIAAVVGQPKSTSTLTVVRADGVVARAVTAAVVSRAFVHVCVYSTTLITASSYSADLGRVKTLSAAGSAAVLFNGIKESWR